MSEQFSVLEILKKSTEFLLKKGISTAKSDSEWILCEFLKIDKIDIYLDNGKITDSKIIDLIRSAVVRRAKREPLQHITGNVDFCSINLKCDTRALIPRYETEQLVDIVAKNIPIKIEEKIILQNLIIKMLLNLNRSLFLKKINKINELNQDEIVVAIGIIIKPKLLK